MNWILGGLAVLFVGPTLLRKVSENPQALKSGADFLDKARVKGIDLGKRGAKAAYAKGRALAKSRGLINGLGLPPEIHKAFAESAFPLAKGYAETGLTFLETGANSATCEAAIKSLNNAMYNHGYSVAHSNDEQGQVLLSAAGKVNENKMKITQLDVAIREKCFMASPQVIRARNPRGSRRGGYDVEF